jgi:hypothetical protein
MMNPQSGMGSTTQTIQLPIVGGNTFGRYAKISTAETFNMMVSDNTLVPYAGYKKVKNLILDGEGRGLYTSTKFQHLIAVVDNQVFSINQGLGAAPLFKLTTNTGTVFISENDGGQIGIADGANIYIYNYQTNQQQPTTGVDFLPAYLDFQDGYFISCGVNTSGVYPIYNEWRLSAPNDGTTWTASAPTVGVLQSKPDVCVATVNFNKQLFIFGQKVTEMWYDVGYTLFPYQRNEYINIDYGCLNPATIAIGSIQYQDSLLPVLCWLGINERSGPTIMYSLGGQPSQLSSDGLNYIIEQLTMPSDVYAFMFRQAGHTFYQITWPTDNVSYTFDFNTGLFFTVTDEASNYHIAKRMAFFNNTNYFLSINDGALYETNNSLFTYNGAEIPRVRVLPPLALPDSSRFVLNSTFLTMEQGQFQLPAGVDLSISKDGGLSYSNILRKELNTFAQRQNRFRFMNLGSGNDLRLQYRFWGFDNFVVTTGSANIYQ